MSEKYYGIRPGPGRKHPDDEIKVCPKCGYPMEYNEDRNQHPPVKWHWCLRCNHEEKVKTDAK